MTSYGYDVRVDRHFKVFTNAHCSIVDPKNFDPKSFVDIEADFCLIPPNSFALAETVEHLEIPRDVIAVCVGKSTYARCGIIVNVTPLEPEWRGRVTIEISNTTPLPAKIYSGEGIAQILFFRAQDLCKISYADKKGKYQDQLGLTLAVCPTDLVKNGEAAADEDFPFYIDCSQRKNRFRSYRSFQPYRRLTIFGLSAALRNDSFTRSGMYILLVNRYNVC